MIDKLIVLTVEYNYAFIAVLFIVKFILFYKNRTGREKLSNFFYFDKINITISSNAERARFKKLQNNLSLAIMFLVLFQLIFLFVVLTSSANSPSSPPSL